MIENYNKDDIQHQFGTKFEMSQIRKCPRCNKRKRRLYIITDSFKVSGGFNSIHQVLCEECIFLRNLEKNLESTELNEEDEDYLKKDYSDINSDYRIIKETTIGDAIFRKIIPVILKYGFNSDGKIKAEIKKYKPVSYQCKICKKITNSHFEISKHLMNEHMEISDDKKDENVDEIIDFVGINIPSKPFVAKLEEMTTKYSGIGFLELISKVYKSSLLFANVDNIKDTEDLVDKPILIPACWANFLERVYIKFKEKLKDIEKETEDVLKHEQI